MFRIQPILLSLFCRMADGHVVTHVSAIVLKTPTIVSRGQERGFTKHRCGHVDFAADAGTATPMLSVRSPCVLRLPACRPRTVGRLFCRCIDHDIHTSPSACACDGLSFLTKRCDLVPVAFRKTEIASVTDSLARFGAKTLTSAAIAEHASPYEASSKLRFERALFPLWLMGGWLNGRLPWTGFRMLTFRFSGGAAAPSAATGC